MTQSMDLPAKLAMTWALVLLILVFGWTAKDSRRSERFGMMLATWFILGLFAALCYVWIA